MHSEELLPNRQTDQEIKVCHISCVGFNVRVFFRGQFDYLQKRGFKFTVITSEPTRNGLGLPDQTTYHSVPLTRSITPLTDIRSIWRLYRIFRRNRFDLVQYTTPKGALLGSIAAWLAKVPVRLYLMWGIYYVGQSGLKRRLFRFLDRLTCRLSTHITFDGFDIRQFAITEGLCTEADSSVIGKGSDNGIDLTVFDRSRYADSGKAVRKRWGIPDDGVVIGTVCRLVGDKGINELVAAFEQVAADRPDAWLLLIGPEEERDSPLPETLASMTNNPRIIVTGLQEDILPYYAAMDIFTLPTYREGFSAVNIEASAMGLPVVTTNAIGAKETVIDGRTGMTVPVKSVEELADALANLLDGADLRRRMGRAGRKWVEEDFEQKAFWEAILRHREDLLIAKGTFVRQEDRLIRKS